MILLGDYEEIERWIVDGRVDCGFLRLPAGADFETIPLARDRLMAILPELILKRIPYRITAKPLDVPAYRTIGVALRDKKTASLAVKRFLNYLNFRPEKIPD